MHGVVHETQVSAKQSGFDESANPNYQEHHSQKFTNGFCHDLSLLSFMRKRFTTMGGLAPGERFRRLKTWIYNLRGGIVHQSTPFRINSFPKRLVPRHFVGCRFPRMLYST